LAEVSPENLFSARQNVRPEIELLLCCARTRFGPSLSDRIASLLAADIDWAQLIGAALAHRVAPLLFNALTRVNPPGVPSDVFEALDLYCRGNRERSAYLGQEFLAIARELEREAIPLIALKGPPLAELAYGDLSLRSVGDLDFLVKEAHVSTVCERLAARGFHDPEGSQSVLQLRPAAQAAYRKYQAEYMFVRDHDGVVVEPHWALVPRLLAVPFDHDGLWDRAGRSPFNGAVINSLAVEDLLLFLCVHGSKHQWTRLQWVCDIAELIAACPDLDWSACLERASVQGCRRMLLLGLALASQLLGSDLPDVIASAEAADHTAVSLAGSVCRRLFLEDNATPPLSKVTPFRLRMRERSRDKLLYVLRTVTTPTLPHFTSVTLPDGLFFLYYPFKLVHDYLALPAWLAVRPLRDSTGKTRLSAERAAQSRKALRETWTTRSEHWARWAQEQSRSAQEFNDLLVVAAGVAPGQSVLDLASGVGEPALSIARCLAGDGLVVATDLVPEMFAALRQRVQGSRLRGLYCCAADMEALPFADGHFDGVVCRLGVMFCPRPEVALAEAHRVLRPGARAAFLTWGPIEQNTLFEVVHRTVGRYLDQVTGENKMAPFRFDAPGRLATLMRNAGFSDVEDREVFEDNWIARDQKFWRPMLEMTYGLRLDDLTDSLRESLDQNLENAFGAHLEDDGYHLCTTMRLVVGRRPSP
jgi:ubiquinone/menaquinone biosynthesis C-methylase UbiE